MLQGESPPPFTSVEPKNHWEKVYTGRLEVTVRIALVIKPVFSGVVLKKQHKKARPFGQAFLIKCKA